LQRSVTADIQGARGRASAEPHTAETVRAGTPCAMNDPDSRLRRPTAAVRWRIR